MPSLINATFWSSIQRFGGLAIGFVSNIVLARLLSPDDYGIVGLIMVFIGLADVLIDGGLGNALIQKPKVDQDDISTVFTSNLILSVALFSLIFLSAPFIASYVEIDKFSLFLRCEAVMILLRTLYVIPFSMMNRNMDFQSLAKINITANFLSTVAAILMAYSGCGVWSLIVRNLLLDAILLLLFFFHYRIKTSIYIRKESFKQLFNFGFFVALSNFLETLYSNLLSFILGKKFSVSELGYYNQAYSLEQIPVYSITSILNQVFFPFLSKEQDDLEKMRSDILKSIRVMSFFIYPLMVYLICYAKPIIVLLYSEKWLPAVPFFQILCIIGFTNFIYHLNRSVLKAIGKTRVLFYSQVIGCFVGILLIVLMIPVGIYAVVISVVINSIIGMIIVILFASRHIHLSLFQQSKEVFLNLVISLIAGLTTYLLTSTLTWSNFIIISLSLVVFAGIYGLFHYILKTTSFMAVTIGLQNYYQNRNLNNGESKDS